MRWFHTPLDRCARVLALPQKNSHPSSSPLYLFVWQACVICAATYRLQGDAWWQNGGNDCAFTYDAGAGYVMCNNECDQIEDGGLVTDGTGSLTNSRDGECSTVCESGTDCADCGVAGPLSTTGSSFMC